MAVEVRDQGATIADLRRRIAAVNPRGTREAIAPRSAPSSTPLTSSAPAPTRPALRLPEHLRPAFPPGGLPRGSMVQLLGAKGPAVSMVAAVTRAGGAVAIVDTPNFGLLAAHEQGGDLTLVATIADAGTDAVGVLSVLADGLDLIVWTPGRTAFTPSAERGLAARLRTKEATLLSLRPGLRRPDYRLDAAVTSFRGIDDHRRYLSGLDTTITSSGRNLAPTRTRIRIERTGGALEASTLPDTSATTPQLHLRAGI